MGVYAIRQLKGRPLVGLSKVTREEVGKPITIVMHPACRVLFQIDSTGLPALEKKYNAELTGPGWWRAAYVRPGRCRNTAPRPLFASSTTGALEFLLPPGRFTLMPYGSDVRGEDRPVEIKPDDRELFLGTIDLAPSEDAVQGRFPDHHRVRLNRDANGKDEEFVLRRVIGRGLRGKTLGVHDVAFSPDGKLLATAHSYQADPGEVKLWDASTGAHVATLPVADKGFLALAFSPDGTFLAGRAYPPDDPRVLMGDRPLGRCLPPRGANTPRSHRTDSGPGLLARRQNPRFQQRGQDHAFLGRAERPRDQPDRRE